MVSVLLIAIFVLGYCAIAFEHPLRLNKAASALITGVLCWTIYIFSGVSKEDASEELLHHFGEISSILFFLLGAMTIVELIDSHNGFEIVTNRIHTTSKSKLLLLVSVITFFLSAILDNLTTAIVMTSLIGKLLKDREEKFWFAGMIVIAANAGGAWSPLGDVTTTMLWIGGQITTLNIIIKTFIPSLIVSAVPLIIVMTKFRNQQVIGDSIVIPKRPIAKEGTIILFSGIALLLFVPAFKTVTHLPPFMGMLLALGLIWIITTVIHSSKDEQSKEKYNVAHALRRIDAPSILFFLGILLAITALDSYGLLKQMATFLTNTLQNEYMIGAALGVLSAVVDNVPLVAAAQGMYDLNTYPTDHNFWLFLALTTGTGGSMIIIGSAAGVAVMGIEKISFGWYLKRISLLAAVGYVAGIIAYIAQQNLTG